MKITIRVLYLMTLGFFLVLCSTFQSKAATPVNGQTDCGLIMNGVFYSDAYPPPGTPATAGSCSWVQTSSTVCAVRNYGGTNYNLYPHKYTCNLPLDDYLWLLLAGIGIIGFYRLRIT